MRLALRSRWPIFSHGAWLQVTDEDPTLLQASSMLCACAKANSSAIGGNPKSLEKQLQIKWRRRGGYKNTQLELLTAGDRAHQLVRAMAVGNVGINLNGASSTFGSKEGSNSKKVFSRAGVELQNVSRVWLLHRAAHISDSTVHGCSFQVYT
ncbi:unnamed protein product [Urochloa humidicola]